MTVEFERRTLLSAGAGLATLATVGTAHAAKAAYDFDKTPDMLAAYARIRGLTPTKLAMWWYAGTIYGQRENEVQEPLVRMEGFSFNRVEVTPDGKLKQVISEAGYYRDLVTNEILSEWTNPLNAQKCKPRHYTLVQNILADETSFKLTDSNMQPVDTRGRTGPAQVMGDTVWIGETFSNKYEVPKRPGSDPMMYPGQFIVRSSLSQFSAKVSDLADRSREYVPAQLSYQSYGGFVPWMRMGREPGVMNTQLSGRKIKSLDELPKSLRDRFEADHAGWLANPKI